MTDVIMQRVLTAYERIMSEWEKMREYCYSQGKEE